MPITRSQSLPTNPNPIPAGSREAASSPSAVSSPVREAIDYPDERTRLFHKLTTIFDLFQPNDLRPEELQRAKAGDFPERLNNFTRIKTQTYMTWANAVAHVALQDENALRIMAGAVPDPMPALDRIKDDISDALYDYSRCADRSMDEALTQARTLEERLRKDIDNALALVDDNAYNETAWEFVVRTLILVVEDLSDQNYRRNSVEQIAIEVMERAIGKIETFPDTVNRKYLRDYEDVVDKLEVSPHGVRLLVFCFIMRIEDDTLVHARGSVPPLRYYSQRCQ